MTTVTFRNGTTVSDGSDETTTLRNGGHRTRFVPALVGTVEAASEAKNWASLLGSIVYDSEYSAKEYAVGTTCPSGSAKSWAVGTGVVAGGLYSAKYYMEQSQLFSNSALNAPGTSATSVSPLTIGTGTKNLTIQTGKAFSVGQFVIIADQTVPANYMVGQILSHNSTTGALSVNVTVIGGTGTGLTNWIVSLTALANAAGAATLGGNNTYSGTNTYGAATTFNATATFSATLDSTGVFNASGDTAKRFRNSGQAAFEIQNGTGAVSNFASVKLITPTKTWEMGTEGGNGRWFLYDGSQDIISATSTATVINKPQRTDAATSANDLVRKAELDNASVQSIVTTGQGALSGFRNRIINGCMRVAQRGTGTSGSAGTDSRTYCALDRFHSRQYYVGQTGAFTFSKIQGTEYVFARLTATSAVSGYSGFSTTWMHCGITTMLEDYNTVDLVNTTSTLSFKFSASVAGSYSVSVLNSQQGGVFITSFNYVSAGVLQEVTIQIPANNLHSGLEVYGAGLDGWFISIGACGGSATKQAPSSSWLTKNASNTNIVASGCVDWSATSNNYIQVTQMQLVKGSVATPFEQRPYQVELAMCQRYYETGSLYGWGRADGAANTRAGYVAFKVPKRTSSFTPSFSGMVYANSSGIAAEGISDGGFGFYVAAAAAGQINVNGTWTASAE